MTMKKLLFALLVAVSVNAIAADTPDDKAEKISNALKRNSAPAKLFPVSGNAGGISGFIRANHLVITNSEGTCGVAKNGVCQIDAYVTRASYKKHRTGDVGAFCGQLLRWESPQENLKSWEPTSGLSRLLQSGQIDSALQSIDEKDRSFCQ